MPWLRYSDDEVLQFHPRFETAANEALRAEGLDTQYEWVHHVHAGKSAGAGLRASAQGYEPVEPDGRDQTKAGLGP